MSAKLANGSMDLQSKTEIKMVQSSSKHECMDCEIVNCYISQFEKTRSRISKIEIATILLFLRIPPLVTSILLPYYHVKDNQKYYKIMGLESNASRNDIRRAYRKLCRKWNISKIFNQQKEKFIEYKLNQLTNAYNILINPIKRRLYDKFSL